MTCGNTNYDPTCQACLWQRGYMRELRKLKRQQRMARKRRRGYA